MIDDTPRDEEQEQGVPGMSEGDKEQAEAGGSAGEVVESKQDEEGTATPGGG